MQSTLSLEQFANGQLTATVLPANATNKNVTWSIVDAKTNVTLTPDGLNAQLHGVFIGTVKDQERKSANSVPNATSRSPKEPGTASSSSCPAVWSTALRYRTSNILMESCSVTPACVKFTGRGGTNWGDTNNPPSTMGGIYTQAVPFDDLEIFYSVDGWIDGGTNHFYVIAISSAPAWFNNTMGTPNTLYFMFAYNNGNVTLRAHHIGLNAGWTHIGVSQGVVAAGGQYSIKFVKVEGGYEVWMKNAGATEYTLQNFEGTTVLAIAETYFGTANDVYVMAGAYAQTFARTPGPSPSASNRQHRQNKLRSACSSSHNDSWR
ncbi:MAG: Ig-like domain-containing protein [Bacillus subtilis]|nr:Ig-like domain-containing protein [Bacillus subtilis]